MGIDYRASYGIGYEVTESDAIADIEEMEDGFEDYLENNVGDGFECFVTGSAYTGDIDGFYLGIDEPFKDGLDLTNAKARLDKEIERLKLDVVGEFGEIGGLYVY